MYLELFLTFLKIGAVSFGGGYGMISLIREEILNHSWLCEEDLLNMIAVSESTPGPLAVNMATFIGSETGGVLGALVATLGVVLPSFIIILIIAAILQNLLKYKGVKAFLNGVRPCVVALILATAFTLFLKTLFNVKTISSEPSLNVRGLIILLLIFAISRGLRYLLKKKISPILMIAISALLGIIVYSPK